MLAGLTGATRLHVIIGDPIAQAKSPAGITAAFARRGVDAVLVPVEVRSGDVAAFLAVADRIVNLDGIVSTLPHKFACFAHCATTTERARLIGAVNVMRRVTGGGWHGDMTDGLGFLGAVRARGFEPSGRHALVVGAGGAGSAVAEALLDAGAGRVAVHDIDAARRDGLLARLAAVAAGRLVPGSADPAGFDLVCNASPAGMHPGDPLPINLAGLTRTTFLACLQTGPAPSPILAAARTLGYPTSDGADLFASSQAIIADFLLAAERAS